MRSVSGLQWVMDAYTLVLASLLVLAGSTADRVGRRRTFQAGLATFTAGSLLCSLAPSLGWLIVFRIVQAVGGSMLNPVAMSIIVNTFTDRAERARAIGVWGAAVGVSLALGPVVGGLLIAAVGWRGIFWVEHPDRGGRDRAHRAVRAGVQGAAGRGGSTRSARPWSSSSWPRWSTAIIEGPRHGWTSPEIIGCFVASAAALVALLTYEPRRDEPLLDLRFFRSAPFSGATLIAVSAFAALGGFLFLNTLYLQDARGYSALHAGLLTLPLAAVTVVAAPLSGRIISYRGPRLPLSRRPVHDRGRGSC